MVIPNNLKLFEGYSPTQENGYYITSGGIHDEGRAGCFICHLNDLISSEYWTQGSHKRIIRNSAVIATKVIQLAS